MRFIHTADWHIGRSLYEADLTTDQGHVLAQLIDMVIDTRADAVVISGDVYDRAIPDTDAVRLLDNVLVDLVERARTQVVVIAGNHDSAQRLGFGSRLLGSRGLHVAGTLAASTSPVVLHDSHGPVHFVPLPYTEPAHSREFLESSVPLDHDAAMRAHVRRVREAHPAGVRSVILAHAFVVGGEPSESERPLSVGGAGTVDASAFSDFNYVALGHLHRPQQVGACGRIQYAGSLLKYSISETTHRKSVTLVEMDAAGAVRTERLELRPRRDLRVIKGTLQALLRDDEPWGPRDDYLVIELTDTGAVLDAKARLQEKFPYVLAVSRPEWLRQGEGAMSRGDHRQRTHLDLFTEFFKDMTGDDLSDAERAAYASTTSLLEMAQREALA